jgi:hypothetical protein
MHLNVLTHLFHQFVVVILLVQVNISYFVLKEKNVSSPLGEYGVRKMSPNVSMQEGGGSKKCHVLFEWPLTCVPENSKNSKFAFIPKHELAMYSAASNISK